MPSLKPLLFSPGSWDLLTCLSLLGLLLATLPVTAILYYAMRLMLFEETIGEALFDIKVLKTEGAALLTSDMLIRSLLLLPSVLMGGALPLLFQKKALHDSLVGTVPVKKKA